MGSQPPTSGHEAPLIDRTGYETVENEKNLPGLGTHRGTGAVTEGAAERSLTIDEHG